MLKVVEYLGLAKVAHSMIGDDFVRGLSGGEKRRVSIGAELISSPAVLVLDEPATGMDSSNARKLVHLLARLSARGTTVIFSVHQPRADVMQVRSCS